MIRATLTLKSSEIAKADGTTLLTTWRSSEVKSFEQETVATTP